MGFFNNEDVSTTSGKGSSIAMLSSLAPLFLLADAGLADDIKPSYFASLGLFVLSAPGLWSLVKRSAKSKVGRKTFEVVVEPVRGELMPLDELAREVSMFFKRNNYVIADAGEVITFEGNIAPERGTAAYITFCAAVGLLCIGLVCSIALPGGNRVVRAGAGLAPLRVVLHGERGPQGADEGEDGHRGRRHDHGHHRRGRRRKSSACAAT